MINENNMLHHSVFTVSEFVQICLTKVLSLILPRGLFLLLFFFFNFNADPHLADWFLVSQLGSGIAGFKLQSPHSCFFPRSSVQASFQGSLAVGLVNA